MTTASRHRLKALALKRVVSGPGSLESRWRLLRLVWVWWRGYGQLQRLLAGCDDPYEVGLSSMSYGWLTLRLRLALAEWRSAANSVRRHNAGITRRSAEMSAKLAELKRRSAHE